MSADSDTARKRLALLRRYRSFSQQHVAQKIGVSLRSYQRIEYGERDLDVSLIFKIAELFDVDANFFLNPNQSSPDYLSSFKQAQKSIDRHTNEKKFLAQKVVSFVKQFAQGPIASPMLEQHIDKSCYSVAGAQELQGPTREYRCDKVVENPGQIILVFELALQKPQHIMITEAVVKFPDIGERHIICISKLSNPSWEQMKIDVQFIRIPEEMRSLDINLANIMPFLSEGLEGHNVLLAPLVT